VCGGANQELQVGGTGLGMVDGDSDEELMALVAAGDNAAFRRLMARHMGRAIRVAETVVRGSAEADDIAQEAFIRIWRNASGFDARVARFTTWMHRIVVNLSIDRKRRNGTAYAPVPEDLADGRQSALDGLLASEQQALLQEALGELPDRQRAAIALFHFEGLSGRDSALAMNLSESAFESLLTRARSALRQRVLTTLNDTGRRS
jgi:RNA polymerase sigma-70 factor, ECF subfamily